MIPATFTLLVAAAAGANALPIFSGFFASPGPRAQPAIQRRDLTGGQLAQGTNAFFGTLLLEDVCTPGQVSCINNNTATCSGEGNWEITPCTGNSTCAALPASTDPSNTQLIVKCTNPAAVIAAIEQAGGSQDIAVNFDVNTAPVNATVTDTPIAVPTDSTTDSSTDSATDAVPTATDSFTDVPTTTDSSAPDATCTGDDGSDDGSDDPTDSDGTPEFTQSLGGDIPEPTGTDASTDPTSTCSVDPSAEPTETEFITVIAFPDPTDSSQFSYSTVEPADATETISYSDPTPTDEPTTTATDTPTDPANDSALPTDPTGTDADVPTPTDPTPCSFSDPEATPTDNTDPTDAPTTTTTTPADSGEPTTLSVPPNFSISSGPAPDISPVGTYVIPVPSVTPAPGRRRSMQKKVRRS